MSGYRYATTVAFLDDELEVEVAFDVAWGSPETGRFGPPEHYDPGSGDVVEDVRLVKVGDQTSGWDEALEAAILDALDEADLNTAALEQEAARAFDPDRARDERIDRELMGLD
jgi:hypothetical protein